MDATTSNEETDPERHQALQGARWTWWVAPRPQKARLLVRLALVLLLFSLGGCARPHIVEPPPPFEKLYICGEDGVRLYPRWPSTPNCYLFGEKSAPQTDKA